MVYNHLNHLSNHYNPWNGWKKVWNIKFAPKTKHFILLLLRDKIKTYNFFSSLKLGP